MLKKKDFESNAQRIIRWIDKYLDNIESYPVKSQVDPKQIYRQIPAKAPDESEDLDQIMQDFKQFILPGITHWQHPNFHAYFPANNSYESILGEMLTAGLGLQCMNWVTSPAAAELEERMMEWIGELLNLPRDFEGVIQDSASSASLVAILTAREKATEFQTISQGIGSQKLRIYCSEETHSSIEKAVRISGIGSDNLIKIETDDENRMRPEILKLKIEEDIAAGYKPCCTVATMGTTGTLSVDPVLEIGLICEKYGVWLHVDAAYAGVAMVLPEYRWFGGGLELADSFVVNAHKWMFTNFDCSCYFVKDVQALLKTLEITPEYLKTKERGFVNDYKDWGIPLGRRFRALKLWFVLRSFGAKAIRQRIRQHIEYNYRFAQQIEKHPDFEIISGPRLNFTGFRFNPGKLKDEDQLTELNIRLLDMINQEGRIFMTHAVSKGKFLLRFVIGQTYVQESHVEIAWKVILKKSRRLIP